MAQAITDVKTFLEDARQAGDGAESGGRCREFDREKAPG